ncbi:hypothetical protein Lser_V15G24617 [Lactuca serriola]
MKSPLAPSIIQSLPSFSLQTLSCRHHHQNRSPFHTIKQILGVLDHGFRRNCNPVFLTIEASFSSCVLGVSDFGEIFRGFVR